MADNQANEADGKARGVGRVGRNGMVLAGLFFLLLFSAGVSLTVGDYSARLGELLRALFLGLREGGSGQPLLDTVVWSIRLPRICTAILVGSALAMAGAALQGLFRNPLADPGLIGVSSGGALGAVMVIVLVPLLLGSAFLAIWLLPLAAFVSGVLVTLMVYRIAWTGGRTEVTAMLLAGIAVNALIGALIGSLIFAASDDQIRTFVFWSMGSLAHGDWPLLGVAALGAIPGLVLLPTFARPLNVLLLGEAETYQLGYDTQRIKRYVIVLAAGMVGVSVAVSGIIAFVGLVVPHLLRLVIGPDHRLLIPASGLAGAVLLLWADMGARTLMAPAELPIGIITALLGAPFFLVLLMRSLAVNRG